MKDVITAILQTPINRILLLTGLVILFFSLFEIRKGMPQLRQLRKGKTGILPMLIGCVLILGGFVYQPNTPQIATPTPTPVSTDTLTPVPPSETPLATESPISTPTSVSSMTPTQTTTLTPTPQIKTLADGCIASRTWQASSVDTEVLNSISSETPCLNLNALGITVESGGKLHLFANAPKINVASGISTPLSDQATIEFKVFVQDLYIVYPGSPAYVTFSIAAQNAPMAESGSGRFKLTVEDNISKPLIFFVLADSTERVGSKIETQHYLYGRTYTIRMELKNIFMQVYINGIDQQQDVTIPAGPKVFYIGYNLPVQAGENIEISDVTIDGKTP